MKLNTVVYTVFGLFTIVKCRELRCPDITQSNECDCTTNINRYYNIYTLQCPKIKTVTNHRFGMEIYTTSYESRFTINCNNNTLNKLIDAPIISPNITKFKGIYFNNCFKNDSNTSSDITDEFNFSNFLNRFNISLDDLILRLRFNEFSFIDENQFFNNFQFQRYFSVVIQNIGFPNSNNSKNTFLKNLLYSKHIELINNYAINFNNFAHNTTLTTIEIIKNRIFNLNQINLAKFSSLYKFELVDCEVDSHDLNAANLFKNNILVELVMKNMTISGSDDDGSNEVIFNEDFLVGIRRLRILRISDNNELYKLPAKFLKSLSDLFVVDLSRNRLHSLDRDMFKYNYDLQLLNLSGNNFAVFDNSQIFQQIKSLRKLYLDHNLLKKFYYNATGQFFFNELQIHGNQLSYDEDITCPFSNILARFKLNLSSNQIASAAALIDCFDKIKELTEMNLENNTINQIELRPLTISPVVLERLFDNLLLANNNITSIDILDEVDWDSFAGEYKKTNLIVDLDLNPLFCENCDLLKHMFNHSYVPITSDFGTVIRFQHPHKCKLSVFCEEQIFYDHDYMCPETCSCRYNEFTRIILIDCVNKGLNKFPLIDYSQLIPVEYFILNFKDNKLTEFTTNGQNPEVFKRLKSINLENNAIETFNLSLLYNKVDEILLQNNRLRITNDFINHFNDREILLPRLKMTLNGNNYCDYFNTTTNLFNAINFDLVDYDLNECVSNSTEGSTTGASSSTYTGHSKLWVIPVILLMMALIGGYVYYRSQVGDTTARFINRLRYRKANVEFESNLIHDES